MFWYNLQKFNELRILYLTTYPVYWENIFFLKLEEDSIKVLIEEIKKKNEQLKIKDDSNYRGEK